MDEVKIGKALEENTEKEKAEAVKSLAAEELAPEVSVKDDTKSIIITIAVIAGVFLLCVGGFKAYNHFTGATVIDWKENSYTYNGFKVTKADDLWWTEIRTRDGSRLIKVPLHFGPKEVETIEVTGELDPAFNNGEEIYIAIDPTYANKYYSLSLSELILNIIEGINRKPISACTKDNAICTNRTILSCNNTLGKPVIELQVSATPAVELSGTCIKVKGSELDLVKATDRLLYKWYRVIEE
ncbi:MAG: hypothetical protein AB1668_01750 [Nanoarchaeota archaeon]